MFETVGADIITSALDGYNGKNQILIILVNIIIPLHNVSVQHQIVLMRKT